MLLTHATPKPRIDHAEQLRVSHSRAMFPFRKELS